MARPDSLPVLDDLEHRFIDVADGVTIHVADAGPPDGPAVMMVHGFPQNWWEWRRLIGPLAADGYRVLCPDLRGAGWSSTPRGRYRKNEMADDLAVVLDRLQVGPVRLVGHDWGGPVAFIMMLRHPEKAAGFFGVNTLAPYLTFDPEMLRELWRFWYQIPIALPVVGPMLIADPKARFGRAVVGWAGAGFAPTGDDFDFYLGRMRAAGHAMAGSRWYRTFLSREVLRWSRGEYADAQIDVPVRWLHGTRDPVLTPTLLRGYAERMSDFELELVDGLGHWIVEQAPDLVLDRVGTFLRQTLRA
ncbi:MAG: alpha/beta hydrolase [Mycolicibacterium sp.]|nr:alpha/beta hydrolase [Mycolicibacterium sp.]